MLKGLPRLEITGTMPTSRYFTAGGWHSTSNLKSWETFQHFKCQVQHFFSIENMFDPVVKHVLNNNFCLENSCCEVSRGWHSSSNLKSWVTLPHFEFHDKVKGLLCWFLECSSEHLFLDCKNSGVFILLAKILQNTPD